MKEDVVLCWLYGRAELGKQLQCYAVPNTPYRRRLDKNMKTEGHRATQPL
jgi:hypothetical protein